MPFPGQHFAMGKASGRMNATNRGITVLAGWMRPEARSGILLCGPMNSQLHEPIKTKGSLVFWYFQAKVS